MQAAQGNTHFDNTLGIITQISMDHNEREIAESVAKARGEEAAQFHAGYDAGFDTGYDSGFDDAKRKIAIAMLKNNQHVEEISKLVDLDIEYIQNLKESFNLKK